MNIKNFLNLLFGLLLSTLCYSQDSAENNEVPQLIASSPPSSEIFYQGSLQGGANVINPITNGALTKSLGGVYYLHFSPQYNLVPHLFVGLELEDYQLGVVGSISNGYGTNMFTYGAGIKIGYYTWMQHDFLLTYSISTGLTYIKFNSVPSSAPPSNGGYYAEAPFLTPNFFAGYRINNTLRIGLELSVVFNFYNFNPYYLGLNDYNTYSSSDVKGITTCFTWGFGIYAAFAEKKTIASKKEE